MLETKSYSLFESILFPKTRVNKNKLFSALNQKTVLITGASYGIGEKLALLLADSGAKLILVARTEEKLKIVQEKVEEKGGEAEIYSLDLRDDDQMKEFIQSLLSLENGIDIFVNNAGLSIRRSIFDSLDRYHDYTRTMAINYFAPVQLLLALLSVLEKNRGQIINISAVNVLLNPAPRWSAYQASKSAFDQWFRSVSYELNTRNITTSTVYLPLVKTRMIEPTLKYNDVPSMKPEHVAQIVCKMIVKRKRIFRPWWLFSGEVASLFLRSFWDKRMVKWIYKDRND